MNIQTPSAGGVSRNTYSQFDVGQKGVILNNAHKNTNTELGGMITANPWLAKGEAKVILNEVNARDPSRLNGYIEVAGQKAQVIIANPAGITCNGCGFINAGRSTLTTGTAQIQNGSISGYQVERGEIIFEGAGLDATRQNHTDIIARAVKVNAAIHAQDLRVTTGRNSVDATHEHITALADNGTTTPQLALDVSQIGGMYAGKIRLLGTQTGVGVRNAGNIGAEAGTVTLSASGRIENSGSVWSAADVVISTPSSIHNSGSIAARNHVTLTGAEITSTGTLAAGVQPDGKMGSSGDLTLSASGRLELHGLNVAGGTLHAAGQALDLSNSLTQAKNITLDARQRDLSTANAQVIAEGTLSLTTAGTLNNDSGLLAADTLELKAKRLQNQKGQISQSGSQALTLNHQDGIDNRDGTVAANATIAVNAASLDNRKGQILAADTGSLSVQTTGLTDNHEGVLAAADSVSLTANQLRNDGGLISAEQGRVALVSKKPLTNLGGHIAAAQDLHINAAGLDSRQGVLVGENITLNLGQQALNNQGGTLAALQALILNSGELNNDEGLIQAGTGMVINTHGHALSNKDNHATGGIVSVGQLKINASTTDNQQGLIAAGNELLLTAQWLDNDSGGLVQSGDNLTLNVERISNRDSGNAGGIVSQGNMSVATSDLQNDAGVVLAGKAAMLNAAHFSNIAGTLVALEALKLATQSDTDNRQGVIQGNGVFLNTHGNLLDNRQGTLYSLAAMQLAAGGVNNQNGTVGAMGDVTLHTVSLDNRSGGRLVGEQAISLTLDRLDNQDGQIQSLGSLVVNAVSGIVDNTLGLIRSGATVTLNAATLLNRSTQAAEKGIEGLDVAIASQQLDNAQGAVLSGNTLHITTAGTLNNTQGELSATDTLSLSGATLHLVNTGGVTVAGKSVMIEVDGLTGDGQLLSLGDMTIDTRQAFDNQGAIIANGNLTFITPGSVTNSGRLLAGAKLNFTAASLLNTTTAEIAAGATWLTVTATLNNYGLIDGSQTWLKAGTLTNAGTGRIYGDHLSLQATTLNNLAQGGKAATIAGRQRVDIGAGTINNRDHALIYSDGALAIGGQVNENGFATGQARTLNNHSATIESAGDMSLFVSRLNNVNDHFRTEVQWVSTEQMLEYQHKGSPDRWDASTEGVFVDRNSADNLLNLNTPDDTGANNDNFYEYRYTRTVEEEVIAESDPGKILSGGQMVISANHVLNDKSQIVAGGTLGIFADTVDNVMPEGSRWITDAGSVTHYSRKSKKGGDSQGKSTADYVPPTVIQSITLSPGRMDGNSQTKGSGMTLSPATARGTDATLNGTGSLSVGVDAASPESPASNTSGKWLEIPASGAENGVIRAIVPDTRLPDTSLFNTRPASDAHYLIETDPRFTNNKQWLGSDYMQDAFSRNHDNMHKRLGDGYYEQRLVREQIIALTGGRYLADHRDDEMQFKALMDAGIAFGKLHQLVPGVALSTEQMSLLKQDMVWLVNTRVQLADGSWQTVMVPQVYVRVQPGDIDGSGALMGGQNLVMNLNRDLVNSGTLHGREVAQISAENITNKAGVIQGADVSLMARMDINNIGGILSGDNAVMATAGRDINITTTTRSADSRAGNNSFERTTIDRMSGIYVQGDDGKLVLNAGQDINLTAAQIVNSGENGQTVLSAGQDLNLTTVTTSASNNLMWDKNNWLNQSSTQQTGSEIVAKGDVLMLAGRDVNARAATVEAGNSLGVGAGRDITLTTATERSAFESHHKATGSSGMLSKTTTTSHDSVNSETARGSLFSGSDVTLQAGNSLLVQGSAIAGTGDVVLSARNDVTLEAATNTSSYYSMNETKKSGVFSSGSGFGVTAGSQSSRTTHKGEETRQSDARSLVGTTGGNAIIHAGDQVTLSGVDITAGRASDDDTQATGHIDISGSDITVLPGRDTVSESFKQETKSSGITFAMQAPFEDTVRNLRDILHDKGSNSTVDKLKALGAEGGAIGLDGPGNIASVAGGRSKSSSESHYQAERHQGSQLTAAGNVQMTATGQGDGSGDILIAGSKLSAGDAVILDAKRDINIVTSSDREARSSKNSSSGWSATSEASAGSAARAASGGGQHGNQLMPGGMNTSDNRSADTQTTQNASVIQGNDIYLNSREGDVNISGSQFTAREDLVISALKGDISVTASENRSHHEASGSSKTVGTLGGDGYSATAGYSRDSYSSRDDASLGNGKRSQLTSTDGDVIVQAGQDLTLAGTDVAAGKAVSLSGENVLLDVSRDSREGHSARNQSQYGVTASAGGWATEAAKAAEGAARSAENGDDARLAAIRAGQAGTSAAQGALSDSAVVKAKASVTAGSSSQSSSYSSTQTQGTTIRAGEDVSITAKNDIVGQGVQVSGKQVTLDAGRDIVLSAAENTRHQASENKGSQFGVGAGVSLIGAQNGISVELGASQQKGRDSGQSQTWTNSQILASEQLTVKSGRDTTLAGAELAGNRVEMNTGRNLTISSVQDTAAYDSQQRSSGASLSLCIPPICYGASSGSMNASGENLTHNGQSVGEQSGIRAGSGGFDIRVGNHTQLDGAAIASTAEADKNRLDTGTLGWTSLHNESSTSGDSYAAGITGSSGGNNQNLAPAIGTGQADEADNGSTRSAISDATLLIRNPENQTQDIADLSRDTDNAHHGVDVNGDVQKVRDDLAVQSEGAALGASVLDVYGKYAQRQAEASNADLAARLTAEGKLDGLSAEEKQAYISRQPEYSSTDYGPGSDYWTRGTAAAGLLAGALGGDLKAGAAAGAAPLLASLVSEVKNPAARAALHGIVAAALTQMKGGSGSEGMAAGAAGAITASLLTERLVSALYNKEIHELTADEKRLVSSLVTVAGAGAGYAAGGDISLAAVGADTARVEVENNSLAHVLAAVEANKPGTVDSWTEEQQAAIREACSGDTPVSCQMVVAAMGTVMSGGLLPEAMVISGAISAGTVGSIDYAMNGSVDPKNVIAAYWVGAMTRSTGLEATMAINAAGGATTSYLDGKNPWVGGMVSGLTGGVAYGVGNKVVEPAMDEVFNPVWKSLGWDDIGMGISKPVQPSLWPSVAGATSGTSGGEYISNKINDKIDEVKSDNGGKNK